MKTINLLKYIYCFLLFGIYVNQNKIRAQIYINEAVSSNKSIISDEDGEYSDWIELFNASDEDFDLEGRFLSDTKNNFTKWVFPPIQLPAKSYMMVWASGKDKIEKSGFLHTNFSISKNGEFLALTDTDGYTILDSVRIPALDSDISFARQPDGSENWQLSNIPTPGFSNIEDEILSPPVFSEPGGIYEESFLLQLSHPSDEVMIIYTTDGSVPSYSGLAGKQYEYKNRYKETFIDSDGPLIEEKYQSHIYTGTIDLKGLFERDNKISKISTTFHSNPPYLPKSSVNKSVVIRAIAYKDGEESKALTHTYFLQQPEYSNSDVYMVSLSVDENLLFDYKDGISVAGADFGQWRKDNPLAPANYYSPANYNRRGDIYEYPIFFELYNPKSGIKILEQQLGVRVHGESSRSFPQKSLRLYARKEYGNSRIKYDFFEDKSNTEYKRLILRGFGFFRIGDPFYQPMVSHLVLDAPISKPAMVYINGEYYGLYDVIERMDKHYFERKYGADRENVDLLYGLAKVKEGDSKHYKNMIDFIDKNSMKSDANMDKVEEMMDFDNFIDYEISEIFSGNSDWPDNNIEYWRYKTPFNPDAPCGLDGRWRWILYDLDYAFGLVDKKDCSFNTFNKAIGNGNELYQYLPYKLLRNERFKNKFINRFADLLNTTFLPERLEQISDSISLRYISQAGMHAARWSDPDRYQQRVNQVKDYVRCRRDEVFRHIGKYFKIDRTLNVTLDINDRNTPNYVRINTIDIQPGTVGISQQPYPWSGVYFENIPITVSAHAAKGYVFSHWEGMPEETPKSFTADLTSTLNITAHFREAEGPQYTLLYTSESGGQIEGETIQYVEFGQSGEPVLAVPHKRYQFKMWSDSSTMNPRTETDVRRDVSVQAIFELISNLDENENLIKKLYPNPSHDVLFVETDREINSIYSYSILGTDGKLLLQGNLTAGVQKIDISSLPRALYLITLSDNTGIKSFNKFIKN